MLSNPKHVSNFPSYVAIINGIHPKLTKKKNPDEMDIKDKLVLNGTTWSAVEEIEYNTIGEFQTSNSNTTGYYIVRWAGNAYTLQEQYKCNSFNPTVIIPEGELVCPAKFMTKMRKHFY